LNGNPQKRQLSTMIATWLKIVEAVGPLQAVNGCL
jgi:hypothetical protein